MLYEGEAGRDVPISLPDRIPDELVARYGAVARRTVRRRRSLRPPLRRRLRGAAPVLRNGDLWMTTLLVFGCAVIAGAVVGALIYASVLYPWAVAFVVVPFVVLFVLSFLIALAVAKRTPAREPEPPSW